MLKIIGYFIDVFVPHPYLAFIPAFAFGFLYYKLKRKSVLTASTLWALYGIYEYMYFFRIGCSGECNIRFDGLLIYPVLVIISIVAIVQIFQKAPVSTSGQLS